MKLPEVSRLEIDQGFEKISEYICSGFLLSGNKKNHNRIKEGTVPVLPDYPALIAMTT